MQQKTRILIVEDEEAIRTGLMDVFVYHGYEVDYADDGNKGLEKALSGTFDMILLDVMLPGIDGLEICNRVRSQDRDQAIIMLTAKTSDEDIIQGLSLGADDYVAKPFSVAQLVLRVQAVLRRSRTGTENDHNISLGDEVIVDCQNLSGTRNDKTLTFTRREMDILLYLHRHQDPYLPCIQYGNNRPLLHGALSMNRRRPWDYQSYTTQQHIRFSRDDRIQYHPSLHHRQNHLRLSLH